ncbi:SRPBCC family protein [Salinibacterium sp. UTAS2018]|uniref:SRPBCC family protein n=1 Tax=Salinibacterium sp. UTAS2018 TaxID=2508880 RepID=UPI0010097E25|nr:SRPBCC family protein [Salinibacterium sp. UTAS2018]QAV71269.1 SRPBCC family protein [Salinibacterium sp. UTAS2018]
MKITDHVYIDAPVDRVFGVFCDLDRASTNISGILSLEVLDGPAQLDVGTKWRETRSFAGKEATEVMWVTDYEQDVTYTVDAESRGTHYQSIYLFMPSHGGTRLDYRFTMTPLTFGARLLSVVGLLFLGVTKKALTQDHHELKVACEAQA